MLQVAGIEEVGTEYCEQTNENFSPLLMSVQISGEVTTEAAQIVMILQQLQVDASVGRHHHRRQQLPGKLAELASEEGRQRTYQDCGLYARRDCDPTPATHDGRALGPTPCPPRPPTLKQGPIMHTLSTRPNRRTYGGDLLDMKGAIDLHCHPFPDLFPRLADDIDIAIAARDAGMDALVLKCHHENTVSRAYLVQRVVPEIDVFGGVVLNNYVGGLNPAAVEAALRLGGREVWMPTVDAGHHGEVHGGTGGYDSQQGGRSNTPIWVLDDDGSLRPEVLEILEMIGEYDAILGTCHLSPREIVALVSQAREVGVERIVVTHPFFKVPNLDLDAIEEIARLGAMPEFGYCTVSPAWQYAATDVVVEAISRVGASRCLLVSDTGQRHNPMPDEALRVFGQTLFERGVAMDDVRTMIATNPRNLLDLDSHPRGPSDQDRLWAAALLDDPCAPPAATTASASHATTREQSA